MFERTRLEGYRGCMWLTTSFAILLSLSDFWHVEERPNVHDINYFTGEDISTRRSILSLREKRTSGEPLTEAEHAILKAANRVGYIRWPCGRFGGNASLVNIGGRDAILTSAHQFFDAETGVPKGECSEDDLGQAVYHPDFSYVDSRDEATRPITRRYVPVSEDEPILGANFVTGSRVSIADDWLILFLDTNVSSETAPDGTLRGYLKFGSPEEFVKPVGFNIGHEPRYAKEQGAITLHSYQSCPIQADGLRRVNHLCDTGRGSSSSILTVLEEGELLLWGIHTNSSTAGFNNEDVYQTPKSHFDWNVGTSVFQMIKAIQALE